MKGEYFLSDLDDTQKCVSIGLNAGPVNTNDEKRGVIIGTDFLALAPVSSGNLCIGREIMESSSSINSLYDVCIGRCACQNQPGSGFGNNTVIGIRLAKTLIPKPT